MNRFTILHTIETGGPGGAETILVALASGLDPTRFRSLALVPREGWLSAALRSCGVPVHVARSRSPFDPTLLLEMRRLVREEKVDLIHSHLPDQNFYSCVAGRLTGTPVVATYHGMTPGPRSLGAKARFKLWCVGHSASAAVAVSDHLRRSMAAQGFPARRSGPHSQRDRGRAIRRSSQRPPSPGTRPQRRNEVDRHGGQCS